MLSMYVFVGVYLRVLWLFPECVLCVAFCVLCSGCIVVCVCCIVNAGCGVCYEL